MKEQSIVHSLNNNARDRKRRMNTHRKASKMNYQAHIICVLLYVRLLSEPTWLEQTESAEAGDAN